MDLQKLDDALLGVFEKRVELSQMSYDNKKYDDVEEELHDLEDDFNDIYGDFLEKAFIEVHREYCSESDVLLPTAYIPKKYTIKEDGVIEAEKKEGVVVELDEDPVSNARLMLLPSPTKIVLMVGKNSRTVWKAV